MKAYKGFNKDMTCRGFQFEEGKEYHEDNAELCKSGFHACLNPLDCFGYYVPADSVYHEVELDDVTDEKSDDSKVCGKRIKIGARLSVANICKLHFDFVKSQTSHTAEEVENSASAGEQGAASAGNCGAASAGYRGAASAGNCGAASAGEQGAASAGEQGAASAGEQGAASAGNCGAAVSRGSSEVGNNGCAVVRGNNVKVKAGIGAVIVIINENDNDYNIKEWKVGVIDDKSLKPDTWYKLENGEFVEVNDEEE
ncbi:MAG: hypothetical protein IJ740_03355 [Ruminococcus sp.]|nr:hypothetical protein [Ruminococcus sp.]